jgi:23S rRNA (adenine(2503)-C(2))-methyltransferase
MDFNAVKSFIKEQKEPSYRLAQIRDAVFGDMIYSWEEAKTLPAELRAKLNEKIPLLSFKLEIVQKSRRDPVFKALLRLGDGGKIETVLMKPAKTWSVCVSSQAGCPLGCAFCATGKMGLRRDLTAQEISDQVLFWLQFIKKEKLGGRVSNVVFMGMGEPLLNYRETVKAVKEIANPDFFNIGMRRVSISTSGIADKIPKLAEDLPQVNLALSLHNADNEERSALMPVNKKFNLDAIKKSLEEYLLRGGREIFIEYIVIEGVNNLPRHIRKLGKWISGFKDSYLLHVNLIACNKAVGKAVETDERAVKQMAAALAAMGVNVSVRRSLGGDISAACGQLAGGFPQKRRG